MTGPTCVWSVGESVWTAPQNALIQFRAQFWAQLTVFEHFRATRGLFNLLIYRDLAWLRGRDLNPRPLGSSPKGLRLYSVNVLEFTLQYCNISNVDVARSFRRSSHG